MLTVAADRFIPGYAIEGAFLVIQPPPNLVEMFVRAGWHPGRCRPVPSNLPPDHPACAVLASFDGLTVGETGTGIECATSDVHFCYVVGDNEISAWNDLLGETLVGIAEVHHAGGELFIDTAGRCYGRSTVHDAFYFEGQTFHEAIERLVAGLRSRPMLRPDQLSVDLYGFTYTSASPQVYKYKADGGPAVA